MLPVAQQASLEEARSAAAAAKGAPAAHGGAPLAQSVVLCSFVLVLNRGLLRHPASVQNTIEKQVSCASNPEHRPL